MKNVMDIYMNIVEPLNVSGFGKPMTKRELKQTNLRLSTFIVGMIVGSELTTDGIKAITKQIKKLNST